MIYDLKPRNPTRTLLQAARLCVVSSSLLIADQLQYNVNMYCTGYRQTQELVGEKRDLTTNFCKIGKICFNLYFLLALLRFLDTLSTSFC